MKVCRRKTLTLVELIFMFVAILGLSCLVMMALRSRNSGPEKSPRISCASNLKQLGLGLKQYAMDSKDFYPATGNPGDRNPALDLLRTDSYVTDTKIYVCPSTDDRHSSGSIVGACSYLYSPGMSEADSADSGILRDRKDSPTKNHDRFGNILFLDGHVTGYPGNTWFTYSLNANLDSAASEPSKTR